MAWWGRGNRATPGALSGAGPGWALLAMAEPHPWVQSQSPKGDVPSLAPSSGLPSSQRPPPLSLLCCPHSRLSLSSARFYLKPPLRRYAGGRPNCLPLPLDPGQVTLPAWSSVLPSVKWQDGVAASSDILGAWNQGRLQGWGSSTGPALRGAPCLFQDGDI